MIIENNKTIKNNLEQYLDAKQSIVLDASLPIDEQISIINEAFSIITRKGLPFIYIGDLEGIDKNIISNNSFTNSYKIIQIKPDYGFNLFEYIKNTQKNPYGVIKEIIHKHADNNQWNFIAIDVLANMIINSTANDNETLREYLLKISNDKQYLKTEFKRMNIEINDLHEEVLMTSLIDLINRLPKAYFKDDFRLTDAFCNKCILNIPDKYKYEYTGLIYFLNNICINRPYMFYKLDSLYDIIRGEKANRVFSFASDTYLPDYYPDFDVQVKQNESILTLIKNRITEDPLRTINYILDTILVSFTESVKSFARIVEIFIMFGLLYLWRGNPPIDYNQFISGSLYEFVGIMLIIITAINASLFMFSQEERDITKYPLSIILAPLLTRYFMFPMLIKAVEELPLYLH